MTREQLITLAEERRIAFISWLAERNSKLTAINNTRAYHDMALLCSTPCWEPIQSTVGLIERYWQLH